jgi:hypothetical protein
MNAEMAKMRSKKLKNARSGKVRYWEASKPFASSIYNTIHSVNNTMTDFHHVINKRILNRGIMKKKLIGYGSFL